MAETEDSEISRAYSDFQPFITDKKDQKYWHVADRHLEKYARLSVATEAFYSKFFDPSKKGAKFATTMRKSLKDIEDGLPNMVKRCDRKSKRDTFAMPGDPGVSVPETEWNFPDKQGVKKGVEALFYQFARWAREEIYWDCPRLGMKLFKRLDRLRWLTVYNYCKRVDASESICIASYWEQGSEKSGKVKENPRNAPWFKKRWGAYSSVGYNDKVCSENGVDSTTTKVTCPKGHQIKFVQAEYGRWNLHTCRGNQVIRETCRRSIDVLAEVAPSCDGRESCEVSGVDSASRSLVLTRNEEQCPGLPKYTRLRWVCDVQEGYSAYGN